MSLVITLLHFIFCFSFYFDVTSVGGLSVIGMTFAAAGLKRDPQRIFSVFGLLFNGVLLFAWILVFGFFIWFVFNYRPH